MVQAWLYGPNTLIYYVFACAYFIVYILSEMDNEKAFMLLLIVLGLLSLCKSLGNCLPVNYFPDLLEIVSTYILVLQIISMFPNIDD